MQPDKEKQPVFKRTYCLPKIEFIKFQLNQSINVPILVLNDTNLTILAYIYVYGKDAKSMIVGHRILTNVNSCVNYFSQLKAQGYIIQEDKVYYLNPKIYICTENYTQITQVEIDHTKNEVYHVYYKAPTNQEG